MYAVTSMPLDSRTRATFRSAEFGFFGVVVYTRVHTPRRWGEPFSAGVLFFDTLSWRPLRTSCWIVGTASFSFLCGGARGVSGGLSGVCLVLCLCCRDRVDRARHRRPPRSGVSAGL